MVNIREEEKLHVRYLLIYYFLQGVGLALFSTVANSLFLSSFSAEELPVAYIVSAIAMLVFGKIYEYVEHKYWSYKRAFLLIIMAASVLVIYLFSAVHITALWLPFACFIWYRVIFNVCDLEFWGLSSQIFDTRQAKRLFGLISAGEAPAKLIGYFSASLLVPTIGLFNLLLISCSAFFAGFFVLRKLLRLQGAHNAHHEVGHNHGHNHGAHQGKKQSILLQLFGSTFIIALGLLYITGSITLTVVDFSFLTEVEEKFHSATELARFFGLTFGIGNAIILLFKLFFSGRAISYLGLKGALLSLPIYVLLVGIVIAASGAIKEMEYPLMVFFVILFIGAELFKSILYEPIFLTLSQPLSVQLRQKAHLVIRGFVDPLGLGLTGLALFGILKYTEHINLYKADFAILGLTVVWIVAVFMTYRKYMGTLHTAISGRFMENKEIDFKNSAARQIIKSKLESSVPEEVIYAYEILSKNDEEFFNNALGGLLRHKAAEVREYALKRLPPATVFTDTALLQAMATSDPNQHIRELATVKYCSHYDDEFTGEYQRLLENDDLKLRYASIKGLMESGNLEAIMTAGGKLNELLQSDNSELHITAASLIGDMKFKNYYKPLLRFFESDNLRLKKTALEAAGKLTNIQLLPHLFELLQEKKLKKDVIVALSHYKDVAITYLAENKQFLARNPFSIVKLCTHIGTQNAASYLLTFVLPTAEAELLDECLKGLYHLEHRHLVPDKLVLEQKMQEQAELIFMLAYHFDKKTLNKPIVAEAFNSELKNARLRLLYLLSLQYDRKTFRQIIAALSKGAKYKNANALEMLDNILESVHQQKILPVFENVDIKATREHLSKYHTMPTDAHEGLEWLFTKKNQQFLEWTYAVMLFSCYDQVPVAILNEYKEHPKRIFRELAGMALDNLQKGKKAHDKDSNTLAMSSHQHSHQDSLMEIEKVLVLKSVSMFAETSESILSGISEIMREQRVDKGSIVFKEGELGDCLYIIYDGLISIHNEVQEYARMGKREIFGELALLDPEPRSATATTLSDTLLLRIDKEDFDELIENQPEIAHGILSILSKRIRNQNNLIRDLKNKSLV